MNKHFTAVYYICVCLAAFFSVLKLFGVIAWPWLWTLSPLWIPIAAVIAILLVILLISSLCLLISRIIHLLG